MAALLDEWDALQPAAGNLRAWLAWKDLSTSRPAGFGAGAIPLSEIECWFRLKALPPSWLLVEKIQAIDGEFLMDKAEREKRRREEEAKRAEAQPARPRKRKGR